VRDDQRGNVSVLVIAVMVVAVVLGTAVARLGGAVAAKSRANNAADAAALAAADGLALGESPAGGCAVARRIAAENSAQLLTCRFQASPAGVSAAEVTVAMGEARARARAEVDAVGIAGYRAGRAPGAST